MKKILITGAEGTIGGALRRELLGAYEISSLTRAPATFPSHVADISSLEAIAPAFAGMNAVVHLAATATVESPWEEVLESNLIGTRKVFEAARQHGVERVVFASSNHTIGGHEVEAAPDLYRLDDKRCFDETSEIRPDSLYGVSKVFGEALGRYYSDTFGMRVVCLRIGTVRADDNPSPASLEKSATWLDLTPGQKRERLRATWLSQRDCAELVRRALEADVRWAVAYGISNNPRQFWSLASARNVLGFEPVDEGR